MSLTPEEIAEKDFLTGLRGYDKEEVRAFLRTVADAFSTAIEPAPVTEEPQAEPEPPTEVDATAAPSASTADTADTAVTPAGGVDWSNVGDEIAAVLRTAHEQAAALRAAAESEAASTRSEADAHAEAARTQADAHADEVRAAAEQERDEAASQLTAAQDEALTLVADAQARVEQMLESSKVRAREEAEASVAGLTTQIEGLITARDGTRTTLGDLRDRLDEAISAAEVPVPAPVDHEGSAA